MLGGGGPSNAQCWVSRSKCPPMDGWGWAALMVSPHLAKEWATKGASSWCVDTLGRRTVASQAEADGPGDAAIWATHPCICRQSPPRASGRKQALLLSLLAFRSCYFSVPCCWVTLLSMEGHCFQKNSKPKCVFFKQEVINQKICLVFWFGFSI